jgi:nucleotide-binding universal stress UspA family protein
MKKVLVALDYDPSSKMVAEGGAALAKSMNAELTLLHVVSDPVYYASTSMDPFMGFGGYVAVDLLQQDKQEGLHKTAQHFLDKAKHHVDMEHASTIVMSGDFSESIVEVANDIKADVIVVGSHSKRWLEKVLLGSVSEGVLHTTSIPLFIIPTKKQD